MNESVETYKTKPQFGTNVRVESPARWLDEAVRTDQYFPSNPMIRPCIDFGRTKCTENSKKYRKHYRASDSHSPGIFTAQWACHYPKLIGLSVMDVCEGISTALSVLLSRFRILPKGCYYDNGCNILKSLAIKHHGSMNNTLLFPIDSTIGWINVTSSPTPIATAGATIIAHQVQNPSINNGSLVSRMCDP